LPEATTTTSATFPNRESAVCSSVINTFSSRTLLKHHPKCALDSSFDWDALDYLKNSDLQYQWALNSIAMLALKGNESILDIGCGDGRITALLAKKTSGKVVGIDSCDNMLSLARRQYNQFDNFSNLEFIKADACDFQLNQRFDIAISNSCLQWVPDHFAVLQSVKKHLNDHGRILFQMAGKNNVKDLLAIADEMMKSNLWKSYFTEFTLTWRLYDHVEYLPWAQQLNFKVNYLEAVVTEAIHNSKNDLISWIRTTWLPFLECLPDDSLRVNFAEELVSRYLAQYPVDIEGKTNVKAVRLFVDLSML
ncbi:MAG: methyltransferase domain-containing protein, partial [Pseudomonadota bacterium]